MPTTYPIVEIDPDDAEKPEYLGSKAKFWLSLPRPGSPGEEDRWLFKAVRRRPDGTTPDGDDWAEKVSAGILSLLNLPHADYELASGRDDLGAVPGVISKRVGDPSRARLVEGNELLVRYAGVPNYPASTDTKYSRITTYTPTLVLDKLLALGVAPPPGHLYPAGVETGADVFVGYLAFDALVGNTDRHDQNWAVFERANVEGLSLAPSYDHASSLGRELSDAKRENRLRAMAPPHDLDSYRLKPVSRFHNDDATRVSPLDAFAVAAARLPVAGAAWAERIGTVDLSAVSSLLARVPESRITPLGMEFALRIVESNRDDIMAIGLSLS